MSKQSSIDWFLSEFNKQIEFRPNSELDVWFKELFPKAKAMHREEIEEAYEAGQNNVDYTASFVDEDGLENYYDKTYSA